MFCGVKRGGKRERRRDKNPKRIVFVGWFSCDHFNETHGKAPNVSLKKREILNIENKKEKKKTQTGEE